MSNNNEQMPKRFFEASEGIIDGKFKLMFQKSSIPDGYGGSIKGFYVNGVFVKDWEMPRFKKFLEGWGVDKAESEGK